MVAIDMGFTLYGLDWELEVTETADEVVFVFSHGGPLAGGLLVLCISCRVLLAVVRSDISLNQ